jgi:hypothetical protein
MRCGLTAPGIESNALTRFFALVIAKDIAKDFAKVFTLPVASFPLISDPAACVWG